MEDFEIRGDSLDLGCGDGVFSFIRANGTFDITFDDYQSIGNLDKFYENIDIHDTFKEKYEPMISKQAKYKFKYALDHKENLLSKAKKLNLYEYFIKHDANKTLPFEDSSIDCVFSNIVYWINDPQKILNEISRILKDGGEMCIDVA